jgi:hypothetical protein
MTGGAQAGNIGYEARCMSPPPAVFLAPRHNVVGARNSFWGCHRLALFRLVAKSSHIVADVDGLACRLYCPTNYDWQARV